jgi:hypothetical protein
MAINAQSNPLSNEFTDNIINFVDDTGEIKATFDFCESKPYFYGDITEDTEVSLIIKKKKSKYFNMLAIKNYCYFGEHNPNKMKNIHGIIYKINIPANMFGSRYIDGKYSLILLIFNNPDYDPKSNEIKIKGKYKLIIYNIYHNGVYFKYLNEIRNYTSL